jgi:hypothetical protein
METITLECGSPCPYESQCEACEPYWQRMIDEGLFKPGEGWALHAIRMAAADHAVQGYRQAPGGRMETITLDCGHSQRFLRCVASSGAFYCMKCGARYVEGRTRFSRKQETNGDQSCQQSPQKTDTRKSPVTRR